MKNDVAYGLKGDSIYFLKEFKPGILPSFVAF